MAEFKIVLNEPKTGKSYQRELKDNAAEFLIGKRIGDKIDGESIDLPGYEFEISGGSDKSGFPMRKDIKGATRAKILAVGGVGLRKSRKGMRKRKTICGNTIDFNIVQVNMKITKYGKEKLGIEAPSEKGEEKAPSADKPGKEEKKEAPAEEEKTGSEEKVSTEKQKEKVKKKSDVIEESAPTEKPKEKKKQDAKEEVSVKDDSRKKVKQELSKEPKEEPEEEVSAEGQEPEQKKE